MSFNRKPSLSKSDSRVTEVLKQYPRSKIETNFPRLVPTNKIPIPTRTLNHKNNEQKQNKENKRYNNIVDNTQKDNNVKYNSNYYSTKNNEVNNTNKYSNSYSNKNEPNKPNRVYKFDISKYRNRNKKEKNEDSKINTINQMSKSENIDKTKIEYINTNINKKNINNNSLNNNKENNENKFKLNFNKYTFVYNNNNQEPIKTPRIKISDVIDNNNNSASYYNKYSQKTTIVVSNRSKINPPVKILETEAYHRRNKTNNNATIINKNNSFSSGLNPINRNDNLEKSTTIITQNSLKNNNIPQPKGTINKNKNKSSNYLLDEKPKKERAHSSYNNKNIYLKTDLISNQKEDSNIEKNNNPIPRVISRRKNSYKIQSINNENKENDNKNDKKYPIYNITRTKNDKEQIKEKQIKTDNNKNDNIIKRKEEKVYISKKPEIINNIKDNKENNNVAFTYISSIKKTSNNKINGIKNKTNASTNNQNSYKNNSNNNESNNFSSNNNSITYIKTSSSKKEKLKDKNENILLNQSDKKPEAVPKPKNLNNYYISSNNNNTNINSNNINQKENIDNDIKSIKNKESENINKSVEKEIMIPKNDSQINNYINMFDSKEKNITPIKSIDIIENIQNNNINIDNSINKLLEKNNYSIKSLNSSKKLEQKIKELESKLDELNNNSTSIFNLGEPLDIDYDYKYSLLNKPGLSETTKAYLNSFLDDPIQNTELSYFSRAYITKLDDINIDSERPVLSGLTKEFLKENDENNDKKEEEINEIKQEDNTQ